MFFQPSEIFDSRLRRENIITQLPFKRKKSLFIITGGPVRHTKIILRTGPPVFLLLNG